ncbi:MAG: radical SAM protein [Promethearchaeota archaeon]
MAEEEILRRTVSLCPECLQNIPAEIYWDKKENKVFMRKTCKEHGTFKDRLSSDPEDFIWHEGYTTKMGSIVNNSTKPTNQLRKVQKGCPYDCGLCEQHKSSPNICLIDLTNRCNLRCPVCFANSAATGYIYEPTFDELVRIMKHFRNIKPLPPPLLQLSGGEPTLRKDLLDIIRKGKELGFIEVMLTTNGIKLAKSLEFTKQVKEAGCDTVYLSFDGIEPETWKKMRGVDLSKIKMQVIENCKEAGLTVVLVPTIVNGINDHEIGNVLDVAKKYAGTVMGVVFQPVALTGRISIEDLNSMRYTTSDLKHAINEYYHGMINKFYPLATTAKLTRLAAWLDDEPQFAMTSHDDCGFATIAVLDDDDNWHAIEEFFDVDGLLKFTNETWDMIQKREIPTVSNIFKINKSTIPKTFRQLLDFTDNLSDYAYRQAMKAYYIAGAARYFKGDINFVFKNKNLFFSFIKLMFNASLQSADQFWKAKNLMISSMHFQDPYNFDIERVQRCLVHYGVIDPDDPTKVREIPFCSMNTIHRADIEKRLAKRKETRTIAQIDKEVSELIESFAKEE